MSYSNVFFDRYKSLIHLWQYDENNIKSRREEPAPLYFYVSNKNGTFKTIDGKNAKKIECKTVGEFRDKVEEYKRMGLQTFESDVSFETKFIVNEYLGKTLAIPQFDIHYFDIEVQSDEGFPRPEHANYPVVAITVWSTKKKKFTIFAEKSFDDSFMKEYGEDYDIIVDSVESSLLKKYIKWMFDEDPDILSGWNSNGFDIPYLINRIRKVLGESWVKRLSPIGKVSEREMRVTEIKTETRYDIAGRSCLDMLEVYKNYTFQERDNYRLGNITKIELGDSVTKDEYSGSISDFYHNDWNGYMKYNIQDTRLLRMLEDQLGYLKMLINFCYGCRVPFEQYMKTTRVLDGAFVSELTREGIVVPDVDRSLKNVSYPGGYVAEPDRGFHEWVVSYDATSLYPSIMMGWNISPEKKVAVLNRGSIRNIYNCWVGSTFDSNQIVNFDGKTLKVDDFCDMIRRIDGMKVVNERGGFHEMGNGESVREVLNAVAGKKYNNIDVCWNEEPINVAEVAKRIKDNNYCIATNGVIYAQDSEGIIPRFVNEWFTKRKEFKKKMLESEKLAEQYKKIDKATYEKHLQDSKYFNLLQLNYKILINSVYGYLGTIYSRFFDFDNCVAVTITGQSMTKTLESSLNSFFSNKWTESSLGKKFNANPIDRVVIYGDTDSIYLDFSKIFDSIKYNHKDKSSEVVKNFIIYGLQKDNKAVVGQFNESGEQIGGLNKFERYDLEENGKTLQNFVSKFINATMTNLSMAKCNCATNRINFKREVVASRGCFLNRKRYVLHALNSEGTEMDKLKATGVELVRSSTPALVQVALKDIIYNILKTMDQNLAEEKLREFRKKFMEAPIEQISVPISVNKYDEYCKRMVNGDFHSVPYQVKAAFFYNKLLDENPKLATTYNRIYDGSKVKLVMLKTGGNQKIPVIAFESKLPPEFGLNEYVDHKAQFQKVFESGVKSIYDAVGWGIPNLETIPVASLFEW